MGGTKHTGRRRSSRFEVVAMVLGLALIVSQAIGVVTAAAGTGSGLSLASGTTAVSKKDTTQAPGKLSTAPRTQGPTAAAAGTSGANIDVDFIAAGPFTYNHTTADGTGNLPRYGDRHISKTTGVVESLEGGDFKCGDLVVFFAKLDVAGGSGSRDVTMNLAFTKEPTGQPGAGFDNIISATLNTKDSNAGGANANLDGNETVSLQNENDNATFSGKKWVTGDVVVTNLNAGESIVAKVVAHLGCLVGSSPTGNLQAEVRSEDSSNQQDTFNIGNQTIPFKKVEDLAQPGIEIAKTADASTVQAGDPIGFTMTVSNTGNVPLSNVSLTDPLPTGPGVSWSVDSTTGDTTGLSCAVSSNALTCTKSSLAAGASFSVHVTSSTTGDSCKTYDNTATVTSGQLTGSASDSVIVGGCTVNLSLTKSASTQAVAAGNAFAYTIQASNDGNGTATNVHVTDTVPDGLTIDGASFTGGSNGPASCDVTGQQVDCNVGNLASGGTVTVTIHVTAHAGACPSVTNTASVRADNETGSTADNSDSVDVSVACSVSVTVVKTNDADRDGQFSDTETAGGPAQDVVFKAVITNTSEVPVTLSSLTDAWPGQSAFTLSCDDGQGGSFDPIGTVLAPGGSLTCAWTEPSYSPAAGSSVTNTVVAGVSSTSGSASGEDTSTVDTPVPPPLGIQIVKDGPALAHVGDPVPYTFDVSLTTSTPLHDVTVTDPRCDSAPTLDTKDGGDQDDVLEPGEVWHYSCTHVVTATDEDPLHNTATVRGTDDAGRQATDDDTHVVDIIHPAIRIVKTANPTSISPGETVTYTYKVTNVGDVTLYHVTVDDDKLGHICEFQQLDVGETKTCTKDFIAGSDNLGPLKNVATAQGTDETGYPVKDTDDAQIDVVLGTTVTPPPTTTPPGGTAFTGSNLLPMVALALVLLLIGTGLLYLGRRREDGSQA